MSGNRTESNGPSHLRLAEPVMLSHCIRLSFDIHLRKYSQNIYDGKGWICFEASVNDRFTILCDQVLQFSDPSSIVSST